MVNLHATTEGVSKNDGSVMEKMTVRITVMKKHLFVLKPQNIAASKEKSLATLAAVAPMGDVSCSAGDVMGKKTAMMEGMRKDAPSSHFVIQQNSTVAEVFVLIWRRSVTPKRIVPVVKMRWIVVSCNYLSFNYQFNSTLHVSKSFNST